METEATTLSSTARTTGDMSGAEAGRVLWRRLTIPAPRHSRTDALHPMQNISRYEKSFSVFRNRNCGTVPGGNRLILPDPAAYGDGDQPESVSEGLSFFLYVWSRIADYCQKLLPDWNDFVGNY